MYGYETAARAEGWTVTGSLFTHAETNQFFGPPLLNEAMDWRALCVEHCIQPDRDALLLRFSNTAKEFPDYDLATLPEIPAHWKDVSWHNEMCPNFEAGDMIYVYVDYPLADDREFPELPERFTVNDMSNGVVHRYDGNDWAKVLEVVEQLTGNEERAKLGAEYVAMIGYNPFEDDPSISVAVVRRILTEYKAILLDPEKVNIIVECNEVLAPIARKENGNG